MSEAKLASTIYRAIVRTCKELDRTIQQAGSRTLTLRQPLEESAWQKGSFHLYAPGTGRDETKPTPSLFGRLTSISHACALILTALADHHQRSLRKLFPTAAKVPEQANFACGDLQALVKANFKAGSASPGTSTDKLLEQALHALRILVDQKLLAECSSACISDGILVEATSSYLGSIPSELSHHDGGRRLWTYRCRVENHTSEAIQLWSRHWIILDSTSKVVAEVPYGSPGVIGQQPVLEPGASFEYYSGTELESASGFMQGSFQCATLDDRGEPDQHIEARVKRFKLLSPQA